jgi:hypothetical protein|uniref:hypothetical protein n=1 Tax=Segatella hominis TaxID=2518605 RepID=UPI00266F5B82|nr:hypothetical protein [uncultured Prevotella sp.]
MKKKEYISPKVVVKIVDYTTMILAGSDQYKQSTSIKVNVDGENIGVSTDQKTDVTDIDYSKQHSAWESWDSWD